MGATLRHVLIIEVLRYTNETFLQLINSFQLFLFEVSKLFCFVFVYTEDAEKAYKQLVELLLFF